MTDMIGSVHYPPPPGKAAAGRVLPTLVAAVLVSIFEAFFVGMAIVGFVQRDWLPVAVGAGLSLGLVLAAMVVVHKGRNQVRKTPSFSGTRTADGALIVDRSPRLVRFQIAAWFILSGALFVAAAGVLLGWGKLPMTDSQEVFLPAIFVVVGIVGGASAITGWTSAAGVLRVSPQGLTIRGRRRSSTTPWASIESVNAADRARQDAGGYLQLRTKHLGVRHVKVDELDLGVPAIYCVLDYYLRHPEARDELGDGRCLDRIRFGGVITKRGWISHA